MKYRCRCREEDKNAQFPIRIGYRDFLSTVSDTEGNIVCFKRRRPKREGEIKKGSPATWTYPEDVIVEYYRVEEEE